MHAKYLAAYALHGLTGLPDGNDVELLARPDLGIIVILTVRPDEHCVHLDRYTVLATRLVNSRLGRTQEEDIETAILSTQATRNKQGAGVFLIVKSEGDIGEPDFTHRDDHRDFIICENAFSATYFRNQLEAVMNGVLAAVSLSLPQSYSRDITHIGDVTYAIDLTSQKPIYSINIESTTTVSVAGPFDSSMVERIRSDARSFVEETGLAKIGRLLVHSYQRKSDDLEAFIQAWAALEIFVSSLFKHRYEQEWLFKLQIGTPPSAQPDFNRLKNVMKCKYTLGDKSLVIALLLEEIEG